MDREYGRQREKALLEWQERLFELRKKYRETPPGFADEEEERTAEKERCAARARYESRTAHRLLSCYEAEAEPFAGRRKYLETMQRQFGGGNSPVILYGIGGIGKTALARAYVRLHQEEYDSVLFLSYNKEGFQVMFCDDCQVAVSNLQYSRDKYENKNRYFREKIKVLAQIAAQSRLLIVIDDCNTESDGRMGDVLSLPCHILVTTRVNPVVWGAYEGIRVTELETEEEWADFAGIYHPEKMTGEEWENIWQYRDKVKGHTLLMMLKMQGLEMEDGTPEHVAEDLFARFRLKRDEKQALRELSIMPVQGIPASLYQKVSAVRRESVERLADCLLVRKEIRRERKNGEETETEDVVWSLHPLIAEAAGKVFAPNFSNCRKLIQGFYLQIWNGWNRTKLENQRLEPYLFALLAAFPEPVPWMARQLEELATFLWIQEYYDEAKAYCRKIVDCVEAYYGKYHQLTGEMYLRMAAVHYNALEFAEADKWYRAGYEIVIHCPPSDARYYLIVSTAASKISRQYRYDGKYDQALKLNSDAIRYARQFGVDADRPGWRPWDGNWKLQYHYHMLDRAKILMEMGRLSEAETICRRSRKAVIDMTPTGFRENEFNSLLAEILIRKQRYEEAEQLCHSLVERAVLFRGPYFKDTLSCRERLADVLEMEKKDGEAFQEYSELLEILEREFPLQREWIRRVKGKIRGNYPAED